MGSTRWPALVLLLTLGACGDDATDDGGGAGERPGPMTASTEADGMQGAPPSQAAGSVATGDPGTGGSGGSGGNASADPATPSTGGTAGTGGGAGGSAGAGGAGVGGAGGAGAGGAGGEGGAGGSEMCSLGCVGGCCNDACVNVGNDILNCGECGNRCEGETPYCDRGECTNTPPCEDSTTCADGFCCGAGCCAAGQLCCEIPGPITFDIVCVTPTESEPTCPMGCLQCDCNAPDTPIATPDGERPIASLRAGDLVYSIDGAAIVAVPVLMAVENPVQDHEVVRLSLEGGAVLEISAGHPLGDGRSIGDLQEGERYDGVRIESAERVGYAHPNTYDVLPDSSSGVYFAAGMPLRSTLVGD